MHGWSPHLCDVHSVETIDSDDTEEEEVEQPLAHPPQRQPVEIDPPEEEEEEKKEEETKEDTDEQVPQWFAKEDYDQIRTPPRIRSHEGDQQKQKLRRCQVPEEQQQLQARKSWNIAGMKKMIGGLLPGFRSRHPPPSSPPPPPPVTTTKSNKRRYRAPSLASSNSSGESPNETSSPVVHHRAKRRRLSENGKTHMDFFMNDKRSLFGSISSSSDSSPSCSSPGSPSRPPSASAPASASGSSSGPAFAALSRARARSISISGASDSSDCISVELPSAAKGSQPPQQQHVAYKPRVFAHKTYVCGQPFGKSELAFSSSALHLVIRSLEAKDQVEYDEDLPFDDIVSMRFDQRASAPHVLLLEIKRTANFHEFYDYVFAQLRQQGQKIPKDSVYGALFTFQNDLAYITCKSAADPCSSAGSLCSRPLSETESDELLSAARIYDQNTSQRRYGESHGIPVRRSPRIEDRMAAFRDTIPLLRSSFASKDTAMTKSEKSIDQHFQETNGIAAREPESSSQHQSNESSRVSSLFTKKTGNSPPKTVSKACCDCSCTCCGRPKKLRANERARVLLEYPFDESDPGRISLTCGDFERLYPGEYLNDNLIDFYFQYLWRHLPAEQQDQIHFFSTHFFTQLMGFVKAEADDLKSASEAFDSMDFSELSSRGADAREKMLLRSERRLSRLLRWTQSMNLFDKKILFIPINDSFHWSLAVVCNVGHAIVRKPPPNIVDLVHEKVDVKEEADDAIAPCILFLDSLQCHRKKRFCNMLRSYLEKEFHARFASRNNVEFDASRLPMVVPEVPLQENMVDCGVFVLMYAIQVLGRLFPDATTNLCTHQHVSTKFHGVLDRQVFDHEHVQSFRSYLQQVIYCLESLRVRGDDEFSIREEGLEHFAF